MGQSTDAILFYGYWWSYESSDPWNIDNDDGDPDEDWEERYVGLKGLHLPKGIDYSASEWSTDDSRRYSEYLDKKRAIVAPEPCIVGTHCSERCPMPYVAIKESVITASRGYPERVRTLSFDPGWKIQLHDFCDLMGIPQAVAGWWMVSDWC